MDETRKTQQDPSGATQDPSGGDKGSTSETAQTFTKESQEKAVSDALSAAGRAAKDLEKREEVVKAAEDRATQARATAYELARAEAKDDPEQLTALDREHKREERDAELTKRERLLDQSEKSHKAKLDEIDAVKRTTVAAEVAVAKGVSVDAILKLAKDDSREAMEAVAEHLPKTTETPPLRPDSSRTTGGGPPETADEKLTAGFRKLKKQ